MSINKIVKRSFRILLVEDNEGDILLTTEALNGSKLNNVISIIKDGCEAVQFLNHKGKYTDEPTPDLVLLDINLPKLNGHEVLKYIKNNEALAHIPVIMFTTSSNYKDIIRSYKNHANCYITKPLDVDSLFEVIQRIEDFWISTAQLPSLETNALFEFNN